jgi:phosphinothricin acetyltransferase
LDIDDLPRALAPEDDMMPVVALIRDCFAYMDGVIDPPSSARLLTPATLAEAARSGEVWVLGSPAEPTACMVLTPRPDCLYLGKLAVAEAARGRALARRLIGHACDRARALGKSHVELQTRVELAGNQSAFLAMGFEETGRTAHPGYLAPTSVTFRKRV